MSAKEKNRIKRQLARLELEHRQLAIDRQRLELEEQLATLDDNLSSSGNSLVPIDLTPDRDEVEVKAEPIDNNQGASHDGQTLPQQGPNRASMTMKRGEPLRKEQNHSTAQSDCSPASAEENTGPMGELILFIRSGGEEEINNAAATNSGNDVRMQDSANETTKVNEFNTSHLSPNTQAASEFRPDDAKAMDRGPNPLAAPYGDPDHSGTEETIRPFPLDNKFGAMDKAMKESPSNDNSDSFVRGPAKRARPMETNDTEPDDEGRTFKKQARIHGIGQKKAGSLKRSETTAGSPKKNKPMAKSARYNVYCHYAKLFAGVMESLPEVPQGLKSQARPLARIVLDGAQARQYHTIRSMHAGYNKMVATTVQDNELKGILSEKLEEFSHARPFWWAKCKKLGKQVERFKLVEEIVKDVKDRNFKPAEFEEYYQTGQKDPEDYLSIRNGA